MVFIDDADQFPEEFPEGCADEAKSWPLGPLSLALYNHSDCARELVAAVLLLCDRQEPEVGWVINHFLMLLRRMLITSPTRLWLRDLLESGLLRALILMTLQCDPRLKPHVGYFLIVLLPASLVYFRTVVAYRNALKDVQDLLSGDALKQTPWYREGICRWEEFLTLADERLEVLTAHQSSSFEAQKACDNSECGSIGESSSLRRCSGCRAFYYCSVQCQRNDWELGHRNACRTHDRLLLCRSFGNFPGFFPT
ncbi:hypothetical protein FB45DRAFT_262510 [Roridomyces roridus]|uniref:MYND-type domain-containing protein n=1 Tax=Roridomyces roridus TaxID=1738132 RepID=A0AAD7B8Q2_9AGAR|nr:hypothetical protein FB45DRAFT_262510 [Roridomyces roridus]